MQLSNYTTLVDRQFTHQIFSIKGIIVVIFLFKFERTNILINAVHYTRYILCDAENIILYHIMNTIYQIRYKTTVPQIIIIIFDLV